MVPDPYAGGPQGFEEVLALVEDACEGLLESIRRQPGGVGELSAAIPTETAGFR